MHVFSRYPTRIHADRLPQRDSPGRFPVRPSVSRPPSSARRQVPADLSFGVASFVQPCRALSSQPALAWRRQFRVGRGAW